MTGLHEDHLIGKPKAEFNDAYNMVLSAPDSEARKFHLNHLIELVAKRKLLTPEQFQILGQFDSAGRSASYHYADDSGKEWHAGCAQESKAVDLFRKYPDLQPQMRELAEQYLWSLSLALKAKPKGD